MGRVRQHQVTSDDGRTLSGLSHGPEDGRPVLFIAGAATSKLMTFGSELLAPLNLRMLTMDRPGLGESTPDHDRTLVSTALDYRAFVSAVLGEPEGAVAVVANSQGAVFGLGLALAGGARSLTLVSPADEVAHPHIHAMLPPEATMLADLARTDAEEAATLLGAFSARAMEEMVMSGSAPEDVAFYRSEPFLSLYRSSLEEGFNNDGVGYVRDTLIAVQPWNVDLAAITCPVQILFGARDLTHSPDHGKTLTSRIPGAARKVFRDAGGALLWTHAQEVLGTALT